MSRNVIRVKRLECRYFTPCDLPDPERLRSELDDVVQQGFAAALSAAFGAALPAGGGGLWLIRKLDFSLDSSVEWSPEQLAQGLASGAARGIVGCMASPAGGGNVLHFRDRAEYLAQFLTDAATGDAWSKWYYDSFAGLRLLAIGDALTAALTRDREMSLEAIACIAHAGFRRILSAMLSQHAEIVWRRLCPRPTTNTGPRYMGEICRLWQQSSRPVLPTLEHRALWLLHASTLSLTEGATDEIFPTIRALAALEESRLLLPPPSFARLLGAIEKADRAGVFLEGGTRLAEWLECLTAAPEFVRTASDALHDTRTSGDEQVTSSATCFGALFLLLPLLVEFPAEAAAPGLAEALRFAIFRRCCPAALHSHVTRDPVVRSIFKIESDDDPEFDAQALRNTLIEWLTDREMDLELASGLPSAGHPDMEYFGAPAVDPNDPLCLIARAILKSFAWRLPGFASSSAGHLWMNFLDVQARMQSFDDRRIVRLTAPPLHVVLSMTGMLGSTYLLPWLDQRPFCLFPEK